MRPVALALAMVCVASCAPTVAPMAPPPAACSALELEEVEAFPTPPETTVGERLAIYQAVLGAVPVELAQAWFRHHEVALPGFARRQAARVSSTREKCLTIP